MFFNKTSKKEKIKNFVIKRIQNLESGTQFSLDQLLPQSLSFEEKEEISKEITAEIQNIVDFKTGSNSWATQPMLRQ